MDRRRFLTGAGKGLSFIAIAACFGGCGSENSNPVASAPNNVDFTIDLNDSAYSSLLTVGGSVRKNNIIVVAVETGTYKAVSQVCTHAGGTLDYNTSLKQLVCPLHGSRFSVTTGSVTQGPATSAVKTYTVTSEGMMLRIKG